MSRSLIAVDADDVVAVHALEWVTFSNDNFGTQLTIEDYNDDWAAIWRVEHEEVLRRSKMFHIPESFLEYERVLKADIALNRLKEDHDLVMATARPHVAIEPTKQWVERYFPGVFVDVCFIPLDESKAEFCQEIGARCLIEDQPWHCNEMAEAGKEAILFGDYSWNRYAEIVPGVTRAKDWPAVLNYFYGRS